MNKSIASILALSALLSLDTRQARATPVFDINGNSSTAETLANGTAMAPATGIVETNGVLNVTGSGTVAVSVGSGTSILNNSGTIKQTNGGRAVRSSSTGNVLTVNNNAGALITATGSDAFQMNKTGTVTINNYGTISTTGNDQGANSNGTGDQALNLNISNSSGADTSYSNTVNNYAGGTISAYEADAIRPGAGGTIYNSGTIISTNASDNTSSSDGIDAQDNNSGITIVNGASQTKVNGVTSANLIEGARHGITGGQQVDTADGGAYDLPFTMSITNNANSTIEGNNGSGINIDGVDATEVVTIVNSGLISGDGTTRDGDGVDVDGLVNLTNNTGGTIVSKDAFDDASEGVTVGGGTIVNSGTIEGSVTPAGVASGSLGRGITLAGVDKTVTNGVDTAIPIEKIYANTTVTNNTGGLIKGDTDSGIAILGVNNTASGNYTAANYSVTITNDAGATIEGAGSVAVIDGSADVIDGSTANGAIGTASANNETVINYGKIQEDGTGKAISLGSGTNEVEILGGSASINGDISGGSLVMSGNTRTSGLDSLVIDPGAGNSFSYSHALSNFDSVAINSGTVNLSGANSYSGGTTIGTTNSSAVLNLSGSIANSASSVNNGVLNLVNGTAGAVTLNNGGSLTGNGTVGALTVNSGGLLSPGNSPGVIHAGNTTFNAGGAMLLQVDTDGGTGTAGMNWDQLAINGTLNASSLSPTGTFQFKLQTLDGSNMANPLGSFNAGANHTWADVITTTGGFVGTFNSSDFSFNTSLFENANLGTFELTQDGLNADDLDLQYIAPIPEPSTWAMLLGGLSLVMVWRKSRQVKKA